MDGRQQQDQQPPRRGRAFPSPQPYQPRRLQDQSPGERAERPPPQQHSAGGSAGGRGRGKQRQRPSGAAGGGSAAARRQQTHAAAHQHHAPPSNAGAAPLQPIPAVPVLASPLSVDGLVAAASDTRQPVAARAAALLQLHQRLFDPAAQRQALQQLQTLWPRLLALLWDDPSPSVSTAAAPAVGAIGALAAQASAAVAAARAASASSASSSGAAAAAAAPRSSSGGSSASGLLFDWLLPVLQQRASPCGRQLAAHQLAAVLLALRDCLTGVDAITLARYANAVFGACQSLLEDEAAPPAALPPLLAVVQQAARHQHSLKARFQDLVDLLLGWALEPALPDTARPALMRTLAAFGAQWRQQPAFTTSLLGSLLADMARLAGKAASEAGEAAPAGGSGSSSKAGSKAGGSLRQLLALAACVVPMLDAAAAARQPTCFEHLEGFLDVCRQAVAAACALGVASPAFSAATVVELAGHVTRLAVLAPAAAAAAAAAGFSPLLQQQHQQQQQAPAGSERVSVQLIVAGMQALSLAEEPGSVAEYVQLRLQIQQQDPVPKAEAGAAAAAALPAAEAPPSAEQARTLASSLQRLFAPVAAFVAVSCSSGSVLAQASTVLCVLAAVRGWLQMLAQQTQQGLINAAGAALLVAGGQPGSSSSDGRISAWLLDLRSYGSKEVVLHAAQLLGMLLQHSPAVVEALLLDTAVHAAALAGNGAEHRGSDSAESAPEPGAVEATAAPAKLLFNIKLLQAAVPQLPPSSLHSLWQHLLPLAAAGGPLAAAAEHQSSSQAWQELLCLLHAAGQRLASSEHQGSMSAEGLALLAGIVSSCGAAASHEPVLLQALHCLQQAAAWPATPAQQAASGAVDAAAAAGVAATQNGYASSSASFAAALDAALRCAEAPAAAVRAAALEAASALVSSGQAGTLLLGNPAAAARLYQTALLQLSDFHTPAAAAAQELLVAAAAPLALCTTLASPGVAASTGARSSDEAAAVSAALEAQRLGFRPLQLQQLLGHLCNGMDGPSAVLTASGQRQAVPLRQWLPRLLCSLPAAPRPAGSPAGGPASSKEGEELSWQIPTCLSLAAWWAVQEAAKQCVASRLRSHHGGPAQTLAALERAVQAAETQLQQEPEQARQAEQGEAAGQSQQEQAAGGAPPAGEARRQAAALLLLFLHALEQFIGNASSGCSSRAAAPQPATAFFAANDKVCQAWFARVRPALLRAAAAAHLHELTVHHALLRLRDLQQQAQALLPSAAATPLASPVVTALGDAADGTAGGASSEAPAEPAATPAAAGAALHTPLADRTPPGIAAAAGAEPGGGAFAAANPAAVLLAATRGSPDMALGRRQSQSEKEPASPAGASQAGRLARQRAQQVAAKAAEAAAAAAAALCALSDVEGIAGLQAYCLQAFRPLLQQLYSQQAPAVAASAFTDTAAAAAASSAWDWLSAAGHQAAGQYEAAIRQYTQLYSSPAAAGMQCAPAGALARMVGQAYAAVGDAEGLQSWLQTKLGSRLPPAAAVRCMQLARWDGAGPAAGPQEAPPLPMQPGSAASGTTGKLLFELQLSSLDPMAAYATSGSAALPATAARLAELAAEGCRGRQLQQRLQLQMQLPPDVLLDSLAAGGAMEGQEQQQWVGQPFSAWQSPAEQQGTAAGASARAASGAASLQPLLLVLGKAAVSEQQRCVLTLAGARTAAAAGNAACSRHLLTAAEGTLAAAGGRCSPGEQGSLQEAAQLLLRLQRLQADARSGSTSTSVGLWQLLLDARSSSCAASVVPAAARLLVSGNQAAPGISTAQAAHLVADCRLPLGSSDAVQLERTLMGQSALVPHGSLPADATAVQYAVLKAAVAAVPHVACQWWEWAAWLHRLAAQQQEQAAAVGQAAWAAAFTASCQALTCGGASSSSSSASGGGSAFSTLPVLLQLLQLMTKKDSANRLPADAAVQLAAVPASAWLPVVPQLLSHLSAAEGDGEIGSHNASHQQLLFSLLQHVGSAAPSQVLLPAMVAAAAQDPAGSAAAAAARRPQPSALLQLVRELQQGQPEVARQLEVLIAECSRLAVLPEEHWQGVLQEAAATAAKRLQAQHKAQRRQQAAADSEGLAEGPGTAGSSGGSGGADGYFAAMAPVLLPLRQQLEAAEMAPPHTPHERQFQQHWLPRLRQLFQELAAPLSEAQHARPGGEGSIAAASQEQRQRPVGLLRAAAAELAAALRPKQLVLADVAPALDELADTGIPIPGAGTAAAGPAEPAPTLAGVHGEVAVLSTKTRPKRLRLTASDGSQHSFLLKGREDLRAEARLMQVLRASHSALRGRAPAGAGAAGTDALAVHCFEVTPLGSRVGLVQWAEGSVPLFELYTGWQQGQAQRQRLLAAAAATQAVEAAAIASSSRTGVRPALPAGAASADPPKLANAQRPRQQQLLHLRPVDIFYAKLKEVGIDPTAPRDAWPLPKLVRVLESMQQTVDRQLLWREVWLGSSGAADWWRRQRSFAASAAAMSVVGHALGLGDRHLDNVLLHRRGAHLVHIDFSVVFDRGLQLKVPEVVPFRLTPTLVSALGVTGVEGAFRLGCERTLGTLRANVAPLCALLEASLLDSGVDWDAELAAKSASKAFVQAITLQAFTLCHESRGSALAAAAAAAQAALSATAGTLAAYVQQFLLAARTACSAAESHALLQRCQATLSSAAAQEQQLSAQAEEGRAAVDRKLAEAQPLAVQLQACLQECQTWQQRHDALLPLLLANPPPALLAGPAASDPAAAAAAGAGPLLLVSAPLSGGSTDSSSPDVGSGSILHAALGMLPAHAPLSASLLLQAAATDKQGQRLLSERAAAAAQLAAALRQYAAAAACLLGGVGYARSSQHAHWLAAFQAAMDLPIPQGFERATELAPRKRGSAEVAGTWLPLAAAASAAVGLSEQLKSTASALQLERVDVALAAADAKEQAVDAAAGVWSAAAAAATAQGREHGAAALALAFAAFTEQQEGAVVQLAAEHQQLEEAALEGGLEEAAAAGAASLLEGVQRLILGYASTAVAARDATSEALFLSADGSSLLHWLPQAVQVADSVSTAAAELQLLLPPLLALLHSPAAAAQVSAAVAEAADRLEDAAQAGGPAAGKAGTLGDSSAEERTAAAAMQPLLAAAGQQPTVAALLEGLQRAQVAAQLLLPADEQPTLAQQQLLLAEALVGVWQDMEATIAAEAEELAGSGSGDAGAAAAFVAAASAPWQHCSAVLASAVAAEVVQHLLPPLASTLGSTARQMRAAAPGLAWRAGWEAATSAQEGPVAALPAQHGPAQLVPFTAFDDALPGAGMLLGGLEEELELERGPAAVERQHGAELDGRQPGGASRAGEPVLVPFLDFDEGLAGADDLLESLEPATEGFEALQGSSQEGLSQPGLSQRSDGAAGEAIDGSAGAGTAAAAAAAAEVPQLGAQLAAMAEASGVLAAVDAVQYVSGLALQQCELLRQQLCCELAAYLWANEHLLPPEATAAAASLLAGAELSVTAAAAAGVALPPVHPAVAGWALRGSRAQVLQQLQAGADTLLSLEAPLQQWQQQQAAAAAQVEAEVEAAMPYAAPTLQQHLQNQQQWLHSAAAAAASLLEVGQAVLQFEASRTADVQPAAGAVVQEEEQPGAAAGQREMLDRYQAEQKEGWRRYCELLRHMQQLQGSLSAAERGVAAASAELEQLRLRRNEAMHIMQSAEAAGSNAAANFAALALPLVRATQHLPPAVAKLLPQLAGAGEWAVQLAAAQRRAAELAAVEGADDAAAAAVAAEARQAAMQLEAAAACVQQLPAAVEGLQAALLPARNRLLAGGRGEAAAKAQAADVVDALSAAVTQLSSQLEKAGEVQSWLAALPARLQALAGTSAQRAAAMQQQHGFTLLGLAALLGEGQGGEEGTCDDAPLASRHGTLTGSLLLMPHSPGATQQSRQARGEFAAGVLRRFRAKLAGQAGPACGSGGDSDVAPAGADVAVQAQVQQLIEAATSRPNLARMYEGWMPWV